MKLADNVRDYLDKRSKDLAFIFYFSMIAQLEGETMVSGPIESPIEQLFFIEWTYNDTELHRRIISNLWPQHQDDTTGKYKIDFVVDFSFEAFKTLKFRQSDEEKFNSILAPKLGIELDGHLWHEKTKEQVQYHKKRERFLIKNGWKLLRFTGSEILRDPEKCVLEVLSVVHELKNKYHDQLKTVLQKNEVV